MDFTECYGDTVSGVAAAARAGCRRTVRRRIQRGFSVDSRDNRGWNALHEAAVTGSKECVQEILSAASGSAHDLRVYVNTLTHAGESACYLAAKHGHLSALRLLLSAQADINQLTNDLCCPLYAAVDGGFRDLVELLIRDGAETNRKHTSSCWSCLHQAVYKGHTEIVRLLVDVCDIEAKDDHNITPLFVAAQYGQQDSLEVLISAGADVNTQAADLATPLLIASQEGHLGCVDFLLDQGADPNMACSAEWPQLPIHAAAEFGRSSVLSRLIAVTDRACDRGAAMVSPLYVAVNRQQSASVAALLGGGFSPDAQDSSHILGLRSPLNLALRRANGEPCSDCVRLLVSAGATLNRDDWVCVLATDRTDLLRLILEHRWISAPGTGTGTRTGTGPGTRARSVPHGGGRAVLSGEELRDLVSAALKQLSSAACWLPVLLKAGLDPSLLLQPQMMEQADGEVLNYLLEFVNWSTMTPCLKRVLSQRRAAQTWRPCLQFDSVCSLSHVCRLQVRLLLGPDLLMRTGLVQQLPVPPHLQDFLRFRHVPEPQLLPV